MQKRKIDTRGSPQSLSQNPFASLDAQKFPELISEPMEVKQAHTKPAKKGRVVLRRETAHRAGKAVIVVYDFELHISENEIQELCKALRKYCGSGGAVKDREIEIQGEQTQRIREFLTQNGFRVAGVQ